MLNVSIRTIDRYIHKGVLSKEEINGRIFINSKDLKPLLDKKKLADQYLSSISSRSRQSEPQPEQRQQPEQSPQYSEITNSGSTAHDDDQIYKNLYNELQEELRNKQERLEGANYRVGQLEGLLKESVPLLDYRKAMALEDQKRGELEELLKTFEKDNEILNQTVDSKKTELDQVAKRMETEKFNKKVFIIILVILFMLQPLWLLFPPAL